MLKRYESLCLSIESPQHWPDTPGCARSFVKLLRMPFVLAAQGLWHTFGFTECRETIEDPHCLGQNLPHRDWLTFAAANGGKLLPPLQTNMDREHGPVAYFSLWSVVYAPGSPIRQRL